MCISFNSSNTGKHLQFSRSNFYTLWVKNHSTCKENYEDTLALIALFAFLQLILSGDIESNPGPIVYKIVLFVIKWYI